MKYKKRIFNKKKTIWVWRFIRGKSCRTWLSYKSIERCAWIIVEYSIETKVYQKLFFTLRSLFHLFRFYLFKKMVRLLGFVRVFLFGVCLSYFFFLRVFVYFKQIAKGNAKTKPYYRRENWFHLIFLFLFSALPYLHTKIRTTSKKPSLCLFAKQNGARIKVTPVHVF